MKKLLLALTLSLLPSLAFAQCNGQFANGQVCGVATGGPALAKAVPFASFSPFFPLAQNQIYVGNASNLAAAVALSQDCTIVSSGAITCTKTNNVAFTAFATQAIPCTIAQGCTAATTQSGAASNIFPTPTRAGDIAYWNGSAWITLAGNNSGTGVLTENGTGVPAYGTISGNTTKFMTGTGAFTLNHAATFDASGNIQDGGSATGTVTSVTCGTGLSGGTFTTTGTCAVSLTTASNVLGADVALNNTANYFDGPSMAQGTSGTWFASGTVTLLDSSGNGAFNCKLWDGTTVIASSRQFSTTASQSYTMHLAGYLASPAANIRISCQDPIATTGLIKFNASGNSKDASVFGFRIQ